MKQLIQEHHDAEQKRLRQLKSRKHGEDQPYHIRNRTKYLIALWGGWVANSISAVTEFAKVNAFILSILSGIVYRDSIALIATLLLITGLELINRFFGRLYFQSFAQNGGHTKAQNGTLSIIIIASAASMLLSVYGGFDLPRLIKDKPEKSPVSQLIVEDITNTLLPLVASAQERKENYYDRRKYGGRISSKDAVKYNEYETHALELENKVADAIVNLGASNKDLREEAKTTYFEALDVYNAEMNQTGIGLIFITIPALLSLYLCLWFQAQYEQKEEKYLDRKYPHLASIIEEANNAGHPLPYSIAGEDGITSITELLQRIPGLEKSLQQNHTKHEGTLDLEKLLQQFPQLQELLQHKQEVGEAFNDIESIQDNTTELLQYKQQPIGYKNNVEQDAYNLLQQMASTVSHSPALYPFDRFTILHFSFIDGKPKRLTQERIDWYSQHYAKKVNKLEQTRDVKPKVLHNAKVKNTYWQIRKSELYKKIQQPVREC